MQLGLPSQCGCRRYHWYCTCCWTGRDHCRRSQSTSNDRSDFSGQGTFPPHVSEFPISYQSDSAVWRSRAYPALFAYDNDKRQFGGMNPDPELLSDQDWASVWHKESHVRCRETIARHLYWACEKDIYKISKRLSVEENWPILATEDALTHLRVRRSSGSITEECCSRQGCTWEEYAEYCPDHRRVRKMDTPI